MNVDTRYYWILRICTKARKAPTIRIIMALLQAGKVITVGAEGKSLFTLFAMSFCWFARRALWGEGDILKCKERAAESKENGQCNHRSTRKHGDRGRDVAKRV